MVNENILLVDAGNSAVKWMMISSSGSSSMLREPSHTKSRPVFFTELWKNLLKPDKVFVSCVATEQTWKAIEAACFQLWGLSPEKIVSPQQWHGLSNMYKQAADLGSDRWCAMVGAYAAAESGLVVVDCGTAITIDIVGHDGKHAGGYILPGLDMMKRTLGHHTALVNVQQKQADHYSIKPGSSTAECVDAGIFMAVVKTIEAVVEEQHKLLGEISCFLTGGNAETVAALLSCHVTVIPDLVLRGLACIAAEK